MTDDMEVEVAAAPQEDFSTVSKQVDEVVVTVRSAASGTVLLEQARLALTATLDELSDMLIDAEERTFVVQCLLVGDTKVPLEGPTTLGKLDGIACGSLNLSIARELKQAKLPFSQVSSLTRMRDYVRELAVQSENHASESLGPIVEKFPGLESLTIYVGNCQRSADSSYWRPLKDLSQLKSIAVLNHHGARSGGALGHEFLQSLVDWGNDGPKLTTLRYEGAMNLSLSFFERWVDQVGTLSSDLETLSIQYWFANPALINDAIFRKITKKWQHLCRIHLGSGCHRLSDAAFMYFRDNAENVQAGLSLEKITLVCCTNIDGNGWLEPDSMKRNLPNLKEFEISASSQFCKCGRAGCGSRSFVKDNVEAIGVRFNHHTTHW